MSLSIFAHRTGNCLPCRFRETSKRWRVCTRAIASLLPQASATRSTLLASALLVNLSAFAQSDDTTVAESLNTSVISWPIWAALAAVIAIAAFVAWRRRSGEAEDYRKNLIFEAHEARESSKTAFELELQEVVKKASKDDLSFVVLRRLLARIKQMQPQRACAALVKFPNADGDRLVCPDPRTQNEFEALIKGHEQALKNVSWTGNHVVLSLRAEVGRWQAQSLAVLPIPIPKPGHGILLIAREPGAAFSDDELDLAGEFAQRTIDSMELAKHEATERSDRELDALTGIFNRQAVELRAANSFGEAQAARTNFSALWIEIDQFRVLIKEKGQEKADFILKTLAQRLQRALERQQLVGRWDNFEFVVLMPGVPEFQSMKLAESLVAIIAREVTPPGSDERFNVSASIGFASKYPSDQHFTRVLERAAKGKDQAKYQGGNCARKGNEDSGGVSLRGM